MEEAGVTLRKGQVWQWSFHDHIVETYLLLNEAHSSAYWSTAGVIEMWEALNLETGQIELVTPEQTAGLWEIVE